MTLKTVTARKEKLNKIIQEGINPYPNKYAATHFVSDIKNEYSNLVAGETVEKVVKIAGRLISRREMGKATFCNLVDQTGKIQIYLKESNIGEKNYKIFIELIDIGDYIGTEGGIFKTKTGELTINVSSFQLLSKTLRSLPEKWHGLRDVETRYRQRYLDLISNPEIKEIFITRSKIIKLIREYLDKTGFLEVETPILQYLPGGALAKPFKTYHNAFNTEMFLRIAPELSLKMLVIGGLEKIYEIGKSFRNEGVDRKHNPEFTMLEIYKAYSDYEDILKLCKELILFIVENLNLKDKIIFENKKVEITNFKTVTLDELFKEPFGNKTNILKIIAENKLKDFAYELKLEQTIENITDRKIFDHVFDQFIQPKLIDPTFVLDYPLAFSPLSKAKGPPEVNTAERFELFIAGEEIANAYSELNDPVEQRKRFLLQHETEEIHPNDENYISALEYGMPPCAGLGIGVDRLTMILTNTTSIREVILFPLLKQE